MKVKQYRYDFSDVSMRVKASAMLVNLGVVAGNSDAYDLLAELLGVADITNLGDEDQHTLSLLAGPHGPVIYKMLLARQEINHG